MKLINIDCAKRNDESIFLFIVDVLHLQKVVNTADRISHKAD